MILHIGICRCRHSRLLNSACSEQLHVYLGCKKLTLCNSVTTYCNILLFNIYFYSRPVCNILRMTLTFNKESNFKLQQQHNM